MGSVPSIPGKHSRKLKIRRFLCIWKLAMYVGGIHEKIDFLNSSQNRYFFFWFALLYISISLQKICIQDKD